MGLLDILNAFKLVKADLATDSYVKAARDLVPGWLALCDFAEGLGFKAGPNDATVKAEIGTTLQDCVDCCDASPGPTMKAGAFDWRTALKALLQTLLDIWKSQP